MHGKGVLIWGDGREYEGDFVRDKRHGYGEFKYKDGKVYTGEWSNGK